MKIAFIINCHANHKQVLRMFKSIYDENCFYLFHISLTSEVGFKDQLQKSLQVYTNVFFPKQEDGTHCEFGIVQGPINALQYLKDKAIDYDYVSLISGQDYPLKSIQEIKDFYTENKGKQFMVSFPILPDENSLEYKQKVWFPTWSNQQKYRFDKFWIKSKYGRKAYPINWIISKTKYQLTKILLYQSKQLIQEKKFWETLMDVKLSYKYKTKRSLPSFSLHGGLTWWNITKEFAEYVLEKIKSDKEYIDFFKNTLIPDEMFMQTLLANSPFKDDLVNDDKRYIVWDWEVNGTHPLTIKKEDFNTIINGNDHFARKFDLVNHPEIFDSIDQVIHNNEGEN